MNNAPYGTSALIGLVLLLCPMVRAGAQPLNDDCAGAISFSVSTTGACTFTPVNTANATMSSPAPLCIAGTDDHDDDVWYTFTAAQTGVYFFRYQNMAPVGTTLGMDLYSECPTGGNLATVSVPGGCTNNFSGPRLVYLTAGVYTLRLFTTGTATTAAFDFCIEAPYAVPVNDECAGALPLAVSVNGACATTTISTLGATASVVSGAAACGVANGNNDDVWYIFKTPLASNPSQSALNFDLRLNNIGVAVGTPGSTIGLQVFSGNGCGALTSVVCNGAAGNGTVTLSLTQNTIYYLRIWLSEPNNMGSVEVCLEAPTNARPSNDECSDAAYFPVSPFAQCIFTAVSTRGATESLPAPSCSGNAAKDDVWFAVTPTTSGTHTLYYQNFTVSQGSGNGPAYQLYSGTCNALTPVVTCTSFNTATGSGVISAPLAAGTTYLLRMWGEGNNDEARWEMCIEGPNVPPATDSCGGAALVPVNATTVCTQSLQASTHLATASNVAPLCQVANPDDDVWLRFVATATTHTITVTPTSTNGLNNPVFQVLSGTCAAFGFPALACVNTSAAATGAESVTVYNLTVGATYFIQVFSYDNDPGHRGAFTVCITTPPAQSIVSVVASHPTFANVLTPSTDNVILRVEVNVTGQGTPVTINQLSFYTTGTTTDANITQARLYYTGTNPNPSLLTQNLFDPGGGITPQGGYLVFTGSRTLAEGQSTNATYYFFLVYDIASGATLGNKIDAVLFSASTFPASPVTIIVQNPPGNRTISNTLPITLLHFRGAPDGPTNRLTWATASEANTTYFVVERSPDGVAGWQEVGRRAAAGNSTGERHYELFDALPVAAAYYRLRSVDTDGAEQLSPIIRIDRDRAPRLAILAAYPVPADTWLTVEFEAPDAGAVTLCLFDPTGRPVAEHAVAAVAGANRVQLPLSGLATGAYALQLRSASGATKLVRVLNW